MSLFVLSYTNDRWRDDSDQAVLFGFIVEAKDQKSAEEWAKQWEINCNNLDAEVDVEKVSEIKTLADLKNHPEVYIKAEVNYT